jgi:hypothetical protein
MDAPERIDALQSHSLVCTHSLLNCALTSCTLLLRKLQIYALWCVHSSTVLQPAAPSSSDNHISLLSGVYWFTPPLCSDLLHPPALKDTHLHYLVHSCTLLHCAPTSFSLLLQKQHISIAWCLLVHSSVLRPPTPSCSKNTHLHYLVCTGSPLCCAPTSCTLLL